jgi:hypothetical protein
VRRPIVALVLSGLLLLGAAPMRAQEPPSPVDYELTCDYTTIWSDRTRVQVCAYPSGTEMVLLAEPSVSGRPLLYMTLLSGLTLWAPLAQRYLPRAWATQSGDVFTTIHPSTPPCQAQVDQRVMYYYELDDGWTVYVAPDGSVACVQ